MNSPSPRRLTVLWLVTLLVIIACAYVASKAFQSIQGFALPPAEDLTRTSRVYREIAEHIPVAVHQLNVLLRVAVDTGSHSELDRHAQRCAELSQWLADRRQTWPRNKMIYRQPADINLTIDVGAMLDDLTVVFDSYTATVAGLTKANRVAQSARANMLAFRLLEIAGLAHGRAEAIDIFLAFATNWSPSYRMLILVTVGVLVMVVIWLSFLTYRLSVVPLRRKLVESTATIAQQQKLAHFGELAAGLAHEIRNPLTAINARLYTLQRGITPGSAEAEDAAVINNEISRLDRTVQDFLRLARPAEPQFAPLTARPLFQEVIDLLGGEFTNRAITIKIAEAAELPFSADRQQLKQVLINLLQNAADAIGQTGTITLSCRFTEHPLNNRLQKVVILEVADTGPGIPAEIQERLFDPFFSTKEHGTGLGLAISTRIITNHNGVLELQSRLGHGAKFSVILPAHA
ncbi:MAG: ATP-binding protein [Verrucomicrobiota bacterium]